MPSSKAILADATARLADAGIGSPRVDAELLLAHVLGVGRGRLLTLDDVDEDAAERFTALVARRQAREPLQHVTGTAPFRHLELAVGPGVFVPRPETELLIDAVLAASGPDPVVVDLCSGSGALALAIADELPGVRVFAVENSAEALVWLRRNAEGSGVTIVEADVSRPVGRVLFAAEDGVDVVVSNPPYVPDTVAVDPEVDADPAVAVFAGADGLSLIPDLVERAQELLRVGGLFVMEHDDAHGEVVPALLAASGAWTDIADHADLTGRPRFVTARRTGAG